MKGASGTKKRRGPAYWNTRITSALAPGTFIGWREVSGYFSDLGEIVEEIVTTQPSPAAAKWLEVLYAGLVAKMNEIHDEGESAMFADDLAVAWITARMKAKADPEETARRLVRWGETDEYGLLGEITDPMLKALGSRGRAALLRVKPDHVDLAKSIAESNGDSTAYLALCDPAELDSDDALALARISMMRRRFDEAGAWIERGLKASDEHPGSSTGRYELSELRKDLLRKLGRGGEALNLEWEEFRSSPSSWSLKDLLRHAPRGDRGAWERRALDAARERGIEALLDVGTALKAANMVASACESRKDGMLETISHSLTEPAAKLLRKSHPLQSGRLESAAGFRIIVARKSTYYDAAIRNFEQARSCFFAAGAPEAWDRVVARIRRDHVRQSGFMSRFERLASRAPGQKEPTFLAKALADQRALRGA